ncbi:DUF6241 domain-containing protein [Niallia sp. Krafla_26]|uniref:DUF6241 domain-containing protein n=1 Tax=Niallia sp. Krafla_26 TaxID=3064703 RepID=UPI003D162A2A
MKKAVVLFLLVILVGAGGYVFFDYSNKKSVTITEKTTSTSEQSQENTDTFIEIQENITEPIEEELPNDMSEGQVQDVIHKMSHQKVRAEEKWGFTPLTMERVNRLIEVVNVNQYDHADVYLDILNRWKESNFSHVDSDHNTIWTLQNGTVGKATGILTVEEEKQLIAKYFNIENEE